MTLGNIRICLQNIEFSVLRINCLLPLLPLESVYSDQIGMVNISNGSDIFFLCGLIAKHLKINILCYVGILLL